MPYPVPPSRLYPPRTAREVFRVRPLRLLEEAFRKSPGVVLAAGAGYGKTSLAAELPAVYVSLAEEAKDPAVFLWHLLAAYENRAELAPVGALLEAGAWPKALEALLEALAPVGDRAHLGISGPTSPSLIWGDGEGYRAVVVPLRV